MMKIVRFVPLSVFNGTERSAALLSALWERRDVRFDGLTPAFVYRFAFRSLRPGCEHFWLKLKSRPAFGWNVVPADSRALQLAEMMRRLDEVETLLAITHWQSESPTLRAFRRAHAGDLSRLPQWNYLWRRRSERQYKWRSRMVAEHTRLKTALRRGL